MQNGFLQEPIPIAEVSQVTIDKLVEELKQDLRKPNLMSPIFTAGKDDAFRSLCEGMSVTQAMARYTEVFDDGIKASHIDLEMDAIRDVATKIGEQVTGDVVADALSDPRLFRRWLRDVCAAIAQQHFGVPVKVAIDVAHLDLPAGKKSWSALMIYVPSVYDEEEETYAEHTFPLPLHWPGRHVIREAWVEYVVYLLRIICALSV